MQVFVDQAYGSRCARSGSVSCAFASGFQRLCAFSDALRLFAEDHLVNQTPIRFDNLWVFGGQSTCNLHFRPELRERDGKAYHHIMKENGIDGGKETLFLSLNDLRQQSPQKRSQYRFHHPFQPWIIRQGFLAHESMKFRKRDCIPEKSGVLLTQPRQRRQIGSFRRRNVPLVPYLRESVLRCRPPQNVLAAIVIGDQRMLQAEPIGDDANARSFESSFGKFRDGGIEDRGSRLNRTLLFGSLAWALSLGGRPPRFLCHFAFD